MMEKHARLLRIALLLAAAVGLLGLLFVGWPAAAQGRTPLLMDGKQTLYQRVLSRPGAEVVDQPGGQGGTQQPALTRFYVYARQTVGGGEWLEVGVNRRGDTVGWIDAARTVPWKQQMTLAFTNPARRERTLMFKDRETLVDIWESEAPGKVVEPIREKVVAGKPDERVVSIEPDTFIDISKKFYLLPILQAEEIWTYADEPVRVLEIASVSASADEAPAEPTASAPEPPKTNLLREFNAALVFVIDTTISMGPYIERTREAVSRIYDRVEAAGLKEKVKFGLVAYRSNVEAVPGLEYTSRLVVSPNNVKGGQDFLDRMRDVEPASVSSSKFNEDAYAGLMTALNEIDWNAFGGRYVVLVTDAGALPGGDPLSGTGLDAEQVRLEAQHRGVALYALHMKTPAGKRNHGEAESQYTTLSRHPLVTNPLYYGVAAGSVDQFGSIVDSLAEAIVRQVNAAAKGQAVPGSARTADPASAPTEEPKTEEERIEQQAELLGHAMQLAYLGRRQGTEAPDLFKSWISDRAFAQPTVATTDVRVLLTKNQLSDLQQVLKSILDAASASQTGAKDFFGSLRSAAAVLGRDPNALTSADAKKISDLGLLGEYLEDLPYRSDVMTLDQDTWTSWSDDQQAAFTNKLRRKLRLYQLYHDDVDRWVFLAEGSDPGESVYPVPLDALP